MTYAERKAFMNRAIQLLLLFVSLVGVVVAGLFLPSLVRNYALEEKAHLSLVENICFAMKNIGDNPAIFTEIFQSLWLDSFLNGIPFIVLCCLIISSQLFGTKWVQWQYGLINGLICVIPLCMLSIYVHYKVYISKSSTSAVALFLFPIYGLVFIFVYYVMSLCVYWLFYKLRGKSRITERRL